MCPSTARPREGLPRPRCMCGSYGSARLRSHLQLLHACCTRASRACAIMVLPGSRPPPSPMIQALRGRLLARNTPRVPEHECLGSDLLLPLPRLHVRRHSSLSTHPSLRAPHSSPGTPHYAPRTASQVRGHAQPADRHHVQHVLRGRGGVGKPRPRPSPQEHSTHRYSLLSLPTAQCPRLTTHCPRLTAQYSPLTRMCF